MILLIIKATHSHMVRQAVSLLIVTHENIRFQTGSKNYRQARQFNPYDCFIEAVFRIHYRTEQLKIEFYLVRSAKLPTGLYILPSVFFQIE